MSDPVTSAEEGAKEQAFRDDEATRTLLADLERELGVTGAGAVFRKALAIAKEASRAGEYSGFSGAGVRTVIGCPADIDLVKRWCEEASTIPYLKDLIKSAEARATAAESEVSRLTERLAKVEAERDEAREALVLLRTLYRRLAERVKSLEAALTSLATLEPLGGPGLDDCGELRARRDFARAALKESRDAP